MTVPNVRIFDDDYLYSSERYLTDVRTTAECRFIAQLCNLKRWAVHERGAGFMIDEVDFNVAVEDKVCA